MIMEIDEAQCLYVCFHFFTGTSASDVVVGSELEGG